MDSTKTGYSIGYTSACLSIRNARPSLSRRRANRNSRLCELMIFVSLKNYPWINIFEDQSTGRSER